MKYITSSNNMKIAGKLKK